MRIRRQNPGPESHCWAWHSIPYLVSSGPEVMPSRSLEKFPEVPKSVCERPGKLYFCCPPFQFRRKWKCVPARLITDNTRCLRTALSTTQ